MDHKGDDTLTVRIGGEAVMVAEGMMTIPAILDLSSDMKWFTQRKEPNIISSFFVYLGVSLF